MKSEQAIHWAQNKLSSLGYQLEGEAEVVRAMPWSQVSRFATSRGFIFFKQMSPQFAVEPDVLVYLHKNFSAPVPQVIAVNQELQCFLMPDVGSRLREKLKLNYQTEIVSRILSDYAHIQLQSIDKTTPLLSLGIKDWRLSELPRVYQQLLSQKAFLQQDGITEAEYENLQKLKLTFNALCEQLASFDIPETIEHGDFQDNNILIRHDSVLFINDWGDANITHPFFSLGSWLDSASRHHHLHNDSPLYQLLTRSYLEQWQDYASMEKLKEAFATAELLRPVLFTINFCRVATCPGMDTLGEFKGYIANALREFIALEFK